MIDSSDVAEWDKWTFYNCCLLRGYSESQRGEHSLHPRDLGSLIDAYVGGELEDSFVLACPVGVKQTLHHRDGAAVVLDHEGKEKPVELRPSRRVQLIHLRFGEHSGHQHHLRSE